MEITAFRAEVDVVEPKPFQNETIEVQVVKIVKRFLSPTLTMVSDLVLALVGEEPLLFGGDALDPDGLKGDRNRIEGFLPLSNAD
jgi:hypothetical protein